MGIVGKLVPCKTINRLQIKTARELRWIVIALLMGALPCAAAPAYTGTVLYQLAAPTGLSLIPLGVGPQQAAGGQVVGSALDTHGVSHPLLWTNAGAGFVHVAIDMTPTNQNSIVSSTISATDGSRQVGRFVPTVAQNNHFGVFWSSSAGSDTSAVDPSGSNVADAVGTGGGQFVGSSAFLPGGATRAAVWDAATNVPTDLHPVNLTGLTGSLAQGTDGVHQVGYASFNSLKHAVLWQGTAASAVDLAPTNLTGVISSQAYGVSGTQQVGSALDLNLSTHAVVWAGSGTSAIDLNPTNLPGITKSEAYGTNGSLQVGYGSGSGTSNNVHAIMWDGSSGDAVDLQQLLPGSILSSTAYTIDHNGNIYGTATDVSGNLYAVEFSPAPEPCQVALGVVVGGGLLTRRSRRRRAA